MLGVEFNKIHIRESLLCWTQNIDTAGCTGSSLLLALELMLHEY